MVRPKAIWAGLICRNLHYTSAECQPHKVENFVRMTSVCIFCSHAKKKSGRVQTEYVFEWLQAYVRYADRQ